MQSPNGQSPPIFGPDKGKLISGSRIFSKEKGSNKVDPSNFLNATTPLVKIMLPIGGIPSADFFPPMKILLSFHMNVLPNFLWHLFCRSFGWRYGLHLMASIFFGPFFLGTFYRSASLYHPQRRAIIHLKTQQKKQILDRDHS